MNVLHTVVIYGDGDKDGIVIDVTEDEAARIRELMGADSDDIDPCELRGVFLQTWSNQ